MFGVEPTSDVGAHQAAFQAVGAFGATTERVERRRDYRSPFRSYQWVAPRVGDRLPNPAQFEQYQCYDISGSGFSFLSPNRPGFRSLVVALVVLPEIIYMSADVVHCTEVITYPSGCVEPAATRRARLGPVDSENGGVPMYLIGCRFIQRLRGSLFAAG